MTDLPDNTTLVPEIRCPYCGQKLDAATAVAGDPTRRAPQPGDVSVCISCASPLVFDKDLRLRKPYMGEIEACPEAVPEVDRIMRAVRSIDRRDIGKLK